jgi:fimbrial chaperone protein
VTGRGIFVRIVCGLAALTALSPAAFASSFSISPLRVDFSAATSTTALTVRNDDSVAVVIQAEGLAWSQASGQDALTPTPDLLVAPAVFTLAPGGSQLVRVALRRPVDPARELSYRLVLQEVPQTARPDFTGLQVALRLSVPVFVAPAVPAQPQVTWVAAREADGKLAVTARNDGTAHARIHRFAVTTTQGAAPVAEQPGLSYVLPGSTRRWTFDDNNNDTRASATTTARPPLAGPYRLEGTTDGGAFSTELTVAAD